MADSNSKKPMALLLLVVVAVLVVIMVSSGGDDAVADFAGHTTLTTEDDCTAAKGTWGKAVTTEAVAATCEIPAITADPDATPPVEAKDAVALENWDGEEATCVGDDYEYKAGSEAVMAPEDSCMAPDWGELNEADCGTANGTWKPEVVADADATPPVEAAPAVCEAWAATSDDSDSEDDE